MEDLARLTALCPPGPVTGLAGSSMLVPASHRRLTETYGTGCFDEFLWIFADGSDNHHLDISARTEIARSIYRVNKIPDIRDELSRHGLSTDDLVQWGATDNGDWLLWLPLGEPEEWPTMIVEAGQLSFAIVSGTSTSILLRLLTGSLVAAPLTDDFPSDDPRFSTSP